MHRRDFNASRNAGSVPAIFRSGVNHRGIWFWRDWWELTTEREYEFQNQFWITVDRDPSEPHLNAPALARGRLHDRLGRGRRREYRTQGQGWSTDARLLSPGRRPRGFCAESLRAGYQRDTHCCPTAP